MSREPVTAERLAKLPQWAQDYINLQIRNKEFVEKQLTQLDADETTIAWEYSPEQTWHGIPKRATIRFQLAYGELEISMRDGTVKVRCYTTGRIKVQPEDYNTVSLSVEPRTAMDAEALILTLRELEAADRTIEVGASLPSCVRCGALEGTYHDQRCPYRILTPLRS